MRDLRGLGTFLGEGSETGQNAEVRREEPMTDTHDRGDINVLPACSGSAHHRLRYHEYGCGLCDRNVTCVCPVVDGCTGCCGRLTVLANSASGSTAIILSLHDRRCMSARDCVCGACASMAGLALAIAEILPESRQYFMEPDGGIRR